MNVVVPYRLGELRKRGFVEDDYTDLELEYLERKVWEVVKLFTNRKFDLRSVTSQLDGQGLDYLFLPSAISTVTAISETDYGTIDLAEIVTYNRTIPDDREDPRVVWIAGTFPKGNQNVSVTGVYGYIDPDSPDKFPPEPLIEVVMRLMPIFVEPLLESEDISVREVNLPLNRREIKSETTDRWTYVKHYKELLKNSMLDDSLMNAILLKYRKGDDIVSGGAV